MALVRPSALQQQSSRDLWVDYTNALLQLRLDHLGTHLLALRSVFK
jgi:hypothetical protein